MQANATKFHYKHTSKWVHRHRCKGINIQSEDMVKMLGINIDKKNWNSPLSCYRSDHEMCIPTECFKAKLQNIKY